MNTATKYSPGHAFQPTLDSDSSIPILSPEGAPKTFNSGHNKAMGFDGINARVLIYVRIVPAHLHLYMCISSTQNKATP